MIRCKECNNISNKYERTYLAVLKERNTEYCKVILRQRHKKIELMNPSKEKLESLKKEGYSIVKRFVYKGKEIASVKRICKNCVQKFKKVI